MAQYSVNFLWDSEAAVWVATSDDIPGLVLESGSLDVLIERVRNAIPELLAFVGIRDQSLSVCLKSERYEMVAV